MKKGNKYLILLVMCIVHATQTYAQWTAQDSLKLKKLLEGSDEIKLNENAIRSINFGSNSDTFRDDPLIQRDSMRFNTTLPSTPYLSDRDTSLNIKGFTLRPYNNDTKFNFDPVNKELILFNKKTGTWERDEEQRHKGMGMMNGTHIMMGKGGIGGTFNMDFNDLLSADFWRFRSRKRMGKALAALESAHEEEAQGRYEYYYLDEYSLSYDGSPIAEGKVDTLVNSNKLLQKGLLYFKYTENGKGDFTLYLPDETYVKGTFNRLWNGYRLFYSDAEFTVTLTKYGGKFYGLRMNLTQMFRSLYPTDEIKEVLLVNTASKISSGNDKRPTGH